MGSTPNLLLEIIALTTMPNRILRSLFLLALCGLLSSCFSYHVRFEKAVAGAAGKHVDLTGPWKGNWKSNWNGHEGPLWCIVTKSPDKPGSYDFRYRAGWGIFKFGNYVHTIPVEKGADGASILKGEMKLPKLFGTHSLEGKISQDAFDAKYKSDKGDHGTMTLRRPALKPAVAPAPPLE